MKIKVKKDNLYFLLSVTLSMIIRFIPEAIFPYVIGFDTPLYFVMGKEWIKRPLPFPLFVALLGSLYFIGVDLLLAMKILPILLYGLLGYASFMFAVKYLLWSNFASLLASLNLSLSIAMLRISWDMHKLTLGVALMLLSLSFWRSMKDVKSRAFFLILSTLTIISHELITVTYLLTMTIFIIRRGENRISALAVLLIGASCFLGAWYGRNPEMVFGWIPIIFSSTPFSNVTYELHENALLILKLYLLTLPASIIGFFKDDAITVWFAFYLLGSLSTIFSPTFLLGGVLPWRYILLLAIPLSTYATRGILILGGKVGAWKPLLALILALFMNFPSYPFLTALNAPIIYRHGGVMPEHMAQTSIPLHDIEPTINLLRKVGHGTLIVYGDFIGWAKYYTNARVIGFGGVYGEAPTLEQALALIRDDSEVFLIFWDDVIAERLGFQVLAMEGNLRLYKYVGCEEK